VEGKYNFQQLSYRRHAQILMVAMTFHLDKSLRAVVTQFWIHQDFLECYFISSILYKKSKKKLRKSLKLKKKYFARVNRIFP
jgi:hypothetical protein